MVIFMFVDFVIVYSFVFLLYVFILLLFAFL